MSDFGRADLWVWVEFLPNTRQPIRIFRTEHAAKVSQAWPANVATVSRTWAVARIRRQVFDRDGFTCVHCGNSLTWNTAHMDERQARGDIQKQENGEYQGGEISVENSQTLCYDCHINWKHDRNPEWGDQKESNR